MLYNRIITLLTIIFIIYSFFYYNKHKVNTPEGGESQPNNARYTKTIDPTRTDLKWYEKLIIKRAKREQEEKHKLEE